MSLSDRQQIFVDETLALFAEGFAGPSSDLGQTDLSLLRELRRVSDIFYAIEPQVSAKKYPLARALLVTCRHMEVDDIIS